MSDSSSPFDLGACGICDTPFTDETWASRHTPHAPRCGGEDCFCDIDVCPDCCWECIDPERAECHHGDHPGVDWVLHWDDGHYSHVCDDHVDAYLNEEFSHGEQLDLGVSLSSDRLGCDPMTRLHRGLLVPADPAIEVSWVTFTRDDVYKVVVGAVGVRLLDKITPIPGVDLVCDDEGVIASRPYNQRATVAAHALLISDATVEPLDKLAYISTVMLVGDVVILGADESTGEWLGLPSKAYRELAGLGSIGLVLPRTGR